MGQPAEGEIAGVASQFWRDRRLEQGSSATKHGAEPRTKPDYRAGASAVRLGFDVDALAIRSEAAPSSLSVLEPPSNRGGIPFE